MTQLVIVAATLLATFCAVSLYTIREAYPDTFQRAPVYALSILVVAHVIIALTLTGLTDWMIFRAIDFFTT